MDRFFWATLPLFRRIIARPLTVFLTALVLAVVALFFAMQLSIDTDISRLLPSSNPKVQALEELREEVGGSGEAALAIESPSFEANLAFADSLIPLAMDLQGEKYDEPYFIRYDFRKDTDFIRRNALYFATDQELDQLEEYLRDEIEQARLDANPFYFDLDEDEEDETDSDGEAGSNNLDFQEVYRTVVPREYPISEDSTTMVIRFYASDAETNVGFVGDLYDDLRELADSLNPESFHPEMEIAVAGRMLRNQVEITETTRDVRDSFGGGVTSVLIVVMLYFFFKGNYKALRNRKSLKARLALLVRMPLTALLIAIPLSFSLAWTFAVAYFAFGFLNLMTSTLVLVLFGLGIDYGIHFFARYAEEREEGRTLTEALAQTYVTAGPPIAMSALTTAVSLYVLVFAKFQGFSQFGFIAGTGILFALLSMLTVLPVIVLLFENLRVLATHVATEMDASLKRWHFPAPRAMTIIGSLVVIAAVIGSGGVRFEYDFDELEPDLRAYRVPREKVRKVYPPSSKRNPAYILLKETSHIEEIRDTLEARAARDTTSPTIGTIETLQERYPDSPADKERRLERIAEIRELLDDKYLRASDSEELEDLRIAAQTRRPVPLDSVPQHLKEQFESKSGEFGQFVMVYPSVGLGDGRNSIAFARDIENIEVSDGTIYQPASTQIVASEMLRLMLRESPWMIGFTFAVVTVLMLLLFQSVRWAGLALVPLVVGIFWMLGIMELFGISLNFYNLVVLPAVLGIGNDCGVHLVHRYREEGVGSLGHVLRSTGEHITIGVLTTMVGFAWWILSYHPGLNSIGVLAVVGLGSVLAASLLFLSAVLQWIEDRNMGKLEQRGSEEEQQIETI